VSQGCVRMLTPHVRQLFDQVDVGTTVVVTR
jgi:lipoprotein-anchoring transpeptidase ErfK/SrfK